MDVAKPGLSTLEAARISRGLTQAGLSEASGIAQSVISKLESGRIEVGDGRRAALARALDVPATLFDATPVRPRLLHRLRPALPAKAVNRLLAELALLHTCLPLLLGDAAPGLNVPFRPFESHPSDRAYYLRAAWELPQEPVQDLTGRLESAGVVCVGWDLSAVNAVAVVSWPTGSSPIILFHETAGPYASRFALAHELGHAVMQAAPGRTPEKDADAFAAELLMPRRRIREDLVDASVDSLTELEAVWGVSKERLADRARVVGAITGVRHRELRRALKSLPASVGDPRPSGGPGLIERVIGERMAAGQRPDDIAAHALMTRTDLDRLFLTF